MTTDALSEWTRPPGWMPDVGNSITDHRVGTRAEWAAAREELLVREKEHTRLGDELARQRRALPWVRVETEYRLDADDGSRTLADLFDGRSQLLIYHFMFGPSYQAGCPINSSIADTVDPLVPHLNAHDVTMLFVSQAPLEKLRSYQQRMGWSFPWVSSAAQHVQRRPRLLEQRGIDTGMGRARAPAHCRRSSNATPARAAPMWPDTSPRAQASVPSSCTTERSIRRMRPDGAGSSS